MDSTNANAAPYGNQNYYNYYSNAQNSQNAAAVAGMLPNAYGYQHPAVQYQLAPTGPNGNTGSQQSQQAAQAQFASKSYNHYNNANANPTATTNSAYDPLDDFKYSKSSTIDHSSSFKQTQVKFITN